MKYSELSEQEKRIWDIVYANTYIKYSDAYQAIGEADRSIYLLRSEQKKRRD